MREKNPYHALTFYFSFFFLFCISTIRADFPFSLGMLLVSVLIIIASWKVSLRAILGTVALITFVAFFMLSTLPDNFTMLNMVWLLSYMLSLSTLIQFIEKIKLEEDGEVQKGKELTEELLLWKLRFETLERQNKKHQESHKDEISSLNKTRDQERTQIYSLRELIDVSHEESLRLSKEAHKLTKEKEHLVEELLQAKQKVQVEATITKKRPAQRKGQEKNQSVFENLREVSQRKQKNSAQSIALTDLSNS